MVSVLLKPMGNFIKSNSTPSGVYEVNLFNGGIYAKRRQNWSNGNGAEDW